MDDRFVVAAAPGRKVVGLLTRRQVVARLADGTLTPDHVCVPAAATGDLSGRWRALSEVFGHVPPAPPTPSDDPPTPPAEPPAEPPPPPPPGPALTGREAVGVLLLTFGQFVSVLGCLVAFAYPWVVLWQFHQARVSVPPVQAAWLLGGAAAAFLYSAAMYVVFSRVKAFRPG